VIGVLPAIPVFILVYMLTAGEPWRMALPVAAATATAAYPLFTQLLSLSWPQPMHDLLGWLF